MTHTTRPLHEISTPEAFAEAFSVSRETLECLKTYEGLLQHWQKTINLVAPNTLSQTWHRHFADSAQIVALAPPSAKTWLDLGSGAGFPGLVCAIMLHEHAKTRFTLVESDTRKAAFLREVARKVAVPVEIVAARIEAAATRANLKGVDVVSARALAPLTRLCALVVPFIGPNTVCLFPKGREAARELQAAELEWEFASELVPSRTDSEARIVRITGLRPKAVS